VLAVALASAGCGPTSRGTHPATAPAATGPPTSVQASGARTSSPYRWVAESAATLAIGGGPTTTLATTLAPAPGPRSLWQIVGTKSAADGSTTATVWTSPDAATWTAVALTPPGVDSQARAATLWGGRTVIVGSITSGTDQRAATWLSPGPAQPFAQVDAPDVFAVPAPSSTGTAGGGASMDVVAAGGLGVFAAGSVAGAGAMWYSTDGHHWSRLKGAEQVIDGAANAHVNALLVAATGVFAAGSVGDGANTDASVWSSVDGITWSQVHTAQSAFTGNGDHTINGLVSLGTGFVAAGAIRSGQNWSPASWISPDGHSWSQPSLAFPLSAGSRADSSGTIVQALATTTTNNTTTVASGNLAAVGGSPSAQRLWTSHDGTSWALVDLPANAAAAADWRAGKVATDGTITIVVDDSTGSPRVLVNRPQGWTEASADPATFGVPRITARPVRLLTQGTTTALFVRIDDPGQALGAETASAAVLTSPDGLTWTPTATSTFSGHTLLDATALASGLVAVGATAALTSTLGAGPTGANAWFSPDTGSWALSPENPAIFGGSPGGAAQADAVTRLGATAVAVGRAAPSPGAPADQAVAWTSSDGRAWTPPVPLDPMAGLAIEHPEGTCAGPQSIVAVGTTVTGGPGSQAAAWSSPDGQHWQAGTVTPAAEPGAHEVMRSCITTGNGYIAFGSTQGSNSTTDAAVWYSNNGTQWTRQSVAAFGGAGRGPVKDLAVGGTTWVAVSGDATSTTAPDGSLALWRTTDAGSSWERIDTSAAPWTAHQEASVDRVTLRGASAIVAGTIDGRLTVWMGTPSAGEPSPLSSPPVPVP